MKKMTTFMKSILAVAVAVTGVSLASPSLAAEEAGHEAHLQSWTFSGLFGTYDKNQLQRGFQIFQEVCSNCHGANLIAFRNLSEHGGPEFTEGQVKALAAEYTIADAEAVDGERAGVPSDRWPSPFETEQDARDANNGALPPDFSVLAKARTTHQAFPFWVFNYFTAYQEGGPDHIYNVLTSYTGDVEDGKYMVGYLGTALSMAPPLEDGLVDYEGDAVPETLEQYATDISAFMMWMADPHLAARKQAGFRVLIFLVLFAGLMYLVKRKLWDNVAH